MKRNREFKMKKMKLKRRKIVFQKKEKKNSKKNKKDELQKDCYDEKTDEFKCLICGDFINCGFAGQYCKKTYCYLEYKTPEKKPQSNELKKDLNEEKEYKLQQKNCTEFKKDLNEDEKIKKDFNNENEYKEQEKDLNEEQNEYKIEQGNTCEPFRCTQCNTFLGKNNPRQLCYKTYCINAFIKDEFNKNLL